LVRKPAREQKPGFLLRILPTPVNYLCIWPSPPIATERCRFALSCDRMRIHQLCWNVPLTAQWETAELTTIRATAIISGPPFGHYLDLFTCQCLHCDRFLVLQSEGTKLDSVPSSPDTSN
jgi:hypothetical protein